MAQPQTPPLLLTKRLTTFLTTRLSPSSHTLLLTTPTGNLLAHASRPLKPASELRAQATVASSLVAMHTGCASLVPHALSASPTDRDQDGDDDEEEGEEEGDGSDGEREEEEEAVAVTVQLAGGVVVIRRLRCGLLLVCVGPPGDEIVSLGGREEHHHHHQLAGGGGGGGSVVGSPDDGDSVISGGAASSVGSVGSVRAQGVLVVRKAAEEVARVLDERLGGLRVPLDAVGAD